MLTKQELQLLKNPFDKIMVKYDYDNPLDAQPAPTQRVIDRNHVTRIAKSIKKWGMLSTITVAATTIYNMKGEKNLRFYIVDSNHRFQACLSLKVPFNMIIIRLNTIEDINNLMSDLNNTSKPWSLDNHITNCAGLQGIVGQHYTKLQAFINTYNNYSSAVIGNLLHFGNLTARKTKMIKAGKFEYNYEKEAIEAIKIFDMVNMVMGNSVDGKVKIALRSINFRDALLNFIRDNSKIVPLDFIKGFADNLIAVQDLPSTSTEWRSSMNKYQLSTL
jgi:hypothetical protein